MDTQKIIEKIMKLRRLSSSSNPHEAAAALAMAERLIAQYQIEEAELALANPLNAEGIDLAGTIIYQSGRITSWKRYLVIELSRLQGCFSLTWYASPIKRGGRGKSIFKLYGKKSDIQLAIYLFEYIVEEILRLADMFAPMITRGVNTFRLSFCQGAAEGIISKMREEQTIAFRGASSTAMVFLGNREKDAENAFRSAFPTQKIGDSRFQSSIQTDRQAHEIGFEQGRDIQVRKGLGQ